MGVLAAAFDKGLKGIQVATNVNYWTIDSGIPKKDVNVQVKIRPATNDVVCGGGTVTQQWIIDNAMIIDELSYAETYDNILRQHLFRTVYQIKLRNPAYIDGTAPATKMKDSFPCQD